MTYRISSVGLEAEIIGCEQYCFVFAKNEDGEIAQFMCDSEGKIVDEGYLYPIPEELAYEVRKAANKAFEEYKSRPKQIGSKCYRF